MEKLNEVGVIMHFRKFESFKQRGNLSSASFFLSFPHSFIVSLTSLRYAQPREIQREKCSDLDRDRERDSEIERELLAGREKKKEEEKESDEQRGVLAMGVS
jgi:hypothetical protein